MDFSPRHIFNHSHFYFQLGHTPEFFTNHEESDSILSHKELLRDFGAEEELADDMLNDQGTLKNFPKSKI